VTRDRVVLAPLLRTRTNDVLKMRVCPSNGRVAIAGTARNIAQRSFASYGQYEGGNYPAFYLYDCFTTAHRGRMTPADLHRLESQLSTAEGILKQQELCGPAHRQLRDSLRSALRTVMTERLRAEIQAARRMIRGVLPAQAITSARSFTRNSGVAQSSRSRRYSVSVAVHGIAPGAISESASTRRRELVRH
jgi:hypothetical protein